MNFFILNFCKKDANLLIEIISTSQSSYLDKVIVNLDWGSL